MEHEQIKFELKENEDMIVVQHNSMVMGRYDMSSLEQKIFLIMLSTIKIGDTFVNTTEFKVKDLAKILNISPQILYRDLKKVCKSLMSKSIELKNDKGDWDLIGLIKKASYRQSKGNIILTLNEESYPYLLGLTKLFTKIDLDNVIDMKSKYAIRIYQQAKSNLYKGAYKISIDEFKSMLKLNQKSYNSYSNIKLKVLKPAIKEIVDKSDIDITFEEIKDSRKVSDIKFIVKKKPIKRVELKKSENKKINGFNNFEGRNYTDYYYKELEKKLLGWD